MRTSEFSAHEVDGLTTIIRTSEFSYRRSYTTEFCIVSFGGSNSGPVLSCSRFFSSYWWNDIEQQTRIPRLEVSCKADVIRKIMHNILRDLKHGDILATFWTYPFIALEHNNIAYHTDTMKALKLADTGRMELKKTCDVPTFLDDEVLVQVAAIAINPFDSKSADLSPTIGATMGCDYAGVVIAVGSSLRKSLLVGDRVCGCVFGNNPDRLDNGAFAEILAAPADLTLRIPDGMTFQKAATLGIGISTTGLALYHILGLPLPSIQPPRGDYVLVNGGATATGTLAIQLLRLQVYLEWSPSTIS
jgi:hypothetical protein